jgi:hypothetical protein
MNMIAATVIVTFSFFLMGLSVIVFAKPALAEGFFRTFASSALAHYVEQAFRLLIGVSLVLLSPSMWQPSLFLFLGWAIVVSSIVLILIPWQWHHRFGKGVIPMVVRHMRLFAVGLVAFGALLLYGVFAAGAPY